MKPEVKLPYVGSRDLNSQLHWQQCLKYSKEIPSCQSCHESNSLLMLYLLVCFEKLKGYPAWDSTHLCHSMVELFGALWLTFYKADQAQVFFVL